MFSATSQSIEKAHTHSFLPFVSIFPKQNMLSCIGTEIKAGGGVESKQDCMY